MTAAPVLPGALIDVSAGGVVRGELVTRVTCAVVTPGGVDTQLVTHLTMVTLINILTHQTLGVHTPVTRATTKMRIVLTLRIVRTSAQLDDDI